MEKETYISVKEFAERAGVSRQAIQQRLETSLAQYVKTNEQGKKTININALQLFGEQGSKAKEQGTSEKSKAKEQGTEALYTALLQTIEILQGQLATKDEQIRSLHIALEAAQQSATQAQALHAGTMQRELIEAKAEATEPPQHEPEKKGFFSRWRKRTE